MNSLDSIQKEIETIAGNLAIAGREFPALIELTNSLPDLSYCYFYPATAQIIMHAKTRAAFAPIRALRRAPWQKHESNDEGNAVLCYRGTLDAGVNVVCNVRELPPSCSLVEKRVLVPAVAEHYETVREITCDAATKTEVELAAFA